jgi:hypothetical protein
MNREQLQDLKIRQIKYFGHIKRHDTLIKTLLEGKVEEQKVDPDTNGRMTSRDGRRTVWQSVTSVKSGNTNLVLNLSINISQIRKYKSSVKPSHLH